MPPIKAKLPFIMFTLTGLVAIGIFVYLHLKEAGSDKWPALLMGFVAISLGWCTHMTR